MKKIAKIFIALGMASTLLFTTGCFGKFALTREVYKFHDSIAGNDFGGKAVKSVLFWVLGSIVYGFTGFVDVFILNVLEFWTGSNPLAMHEGQKEIQIVKHNGVEYQITATKNKFEVVQLSGKDKGLTQNVTFNENQMAWYSNIDGKSTKIIQYNVENGVIVSTQMFKADGTSIVLNENMLNNMTASVAAR